MTENPPAAPDSCEHHFVYRILGGQPIGVDICQFCHDPNWADLAEQAARIYRWGRDEALAGKPARDRLSAYDMPREDEPPAEEAPAAASDPAPYRRLLARLEADRAGHLRAAGQATDGRLRDVGSSYAAALHHAATLAVVEFEGAEAARECAQQTSGGEAGEGDATDLREQVADVLRPWLLGADEGDVEHAADAVLAVLPVPADRGAVLTETERTMLAYALDQAQEHIYSRDGFTDEDQAAVTSLRRLAEEAQRAGEGR